MEQLIECWTRQEGKAEPEQGIEIQDEAIAGRGAGARQEGEAATNGEELDADTVRQPGPAGKEIRPEDDGLERHGEGEEQENNIIIVGEEEREDAAIQDEHLEQEDSGYVL